MNSSARAFVTSLLLSATPFAYAQEDGNEPQDVDSIQTTEITQSISGYALREVLNIPDIGLDRLVFNALPIAQYDLGITPAGSDWTYSLQLAADEVNTDIETINIDKAGITPGNMLVGATNGTTTLQAGRIDDAISPHSVAWNAFVNGITPAYAEEQSFLDTTRLDVIGAQGSHIFSLNETDNLVLNGAIYTGDNWNPVWGQDVDSLPHDLETSGRFSLEYQTTHNGLDYALAGEFAAANFQVADDETRASLFARASGTHGDMDWMAIVEVNHFENRLGASADDGLSGTVYGQLQGPINEIFSWHVAGSISGGEFDSTPLAIAPQAGFSVDLCKAFGDGCKNSNINLVGAYSPTYYPDKNKLDLGSGVFGLNYSVNF